MAWPTYSGGGEYPQFNYNPGVAPDTGEGLAKGISALGSGVAGAIEKHDVDLQKDAANQLVFSQALQSGQINPQVLGYKPGETPSNAEMFAKFSGATRQQQSGWTSALIGNYMGNLQKQQAETAHLWGQAEHAQAQATAEGAGGSLGPPTVAPIPGTGFGTVTYGKTLNVVPMGTPTFTTDPKTKVTTVTYGRSTNVVPQQDIMLAKINAQAEAAVAEAARKEQQEGTPGLKQKAQQKWDDIKKAVFGTPGTGGATAAPIGPTPAGPPLGAPSASSGTPLPGATTGFTQGGKYTDSAGNQAIYGGKDATGKDIWQPVR